MFYSEGKDIDKKSRGQFAGLLERNATRFEDSEEVFPRLGTILDEDRFEKLRELHYSALSKKEIKVDAGFVKLREEYADKMKVHVEPVTLNSPSSRSFGALLGKRLAPVGNSGGGFRDLEAYFEKVSKGWEVDFDPNKLLEKQVVDLMMLDLLPKYERDTNETILDVERQVREAEISKDLARAKALNTTLKLLRSMKSFDESDRIHKKMVIQVKNDTE